MYSGVQSLSGHFATIARCRSKRGEIDTSALFHSDVSAMNGVVSLSGKAKHAAEIDLAKIYVSDINGVYRVKNHMTSEQSKWTVELSSAGVFQYPDSAIPGNPKGESNVVDDGCDTACSVTPGLVSNYTMGGLIHVLLVIAIIVILVNVIQGWRL